MSVKMQKTAVVLVESKKTHPIYRKSFKFSTKFLVDDPFEVTLGDVVIFEKIAPISKRKHWRITKVLGKDIVSLEQAELLEDAQEAIAEVMPEEKDEAELTVDSPEAAEKVEVKEEKPVKKAAAKKKGAK